jgi:hypothetical protein
MADNERDLMQWQVGTQTVFETAVTPTAKLLGIEEGEIQPLVETSAVMEQRASLAPAYAATVDSVTGEASVKGDATFEQLGYFLDSLLGQAAPSGAGPYVRAYAAPLGTKPAPRILTLTHGSALDARCLKGGIVNELTLTAEKNTRVKHEAKLIGHSVESDALAALSDIVPNWIHGNQVALTIDTWGGTMGGTALTPIAYKYELGLNFNKMVQMGLGAVTPRDHKIKKGEPDSNQLKIAMELHATSAGWFNDIITATATPWRAQVQATFTLSTAILVIKYAGFAAEAPKYVEDDDGIASLEFTLSPMYHATVANWLKIDLTNSVAVLA